MVLPVTSKGNAGFAVAMPTRFATESTVSVFESMATFPVTVKEDNVPTLGTIGWAAVCSVPNRLVPDTVVPLTFPAATLPVTFSEDKVPTLVIVGWAAVRIVPTRLVPDTVVPLTFPVATFPVTVKEDNVPTVFKADVSTVLPSALALRTDVPLIR